MTRTSAKPRRLACASSAVDGEFVASMVAASVLISLREMIVLSRSERSTSSREAAIDEERSARDVSARFAGQMGHHVGNVFRLAVPAKRAVAWA